MFLKTKSIAVHGYITCVSVCKDLLQCAKTVYHYTFCVISFFFGFFFVSGDIS